MEHLLKSALLYTLNNPAASSSTVTCVCDLVIKEPMSSGRAPPRAPYSSTLKKHRWIEAAEVEISPQHHQGQKAFPSEAKGPLLTGSFNLSEYFRQFLFPQNECELHDFRLSFSQLQWDNWIVAPHRYNLGYCKGDCPRVVRHRYVSPVHTMVQNIIYEKLDPSVPRPSCVPGKYSPLSVLTIEPDRSIAYKVYEDMIATRCTCSYCGAHYNSASSLPGRAMLLALECLGRELPVINVSVPHSAHCVSWGSVCVDEHGVCNINRYKGHTHWLLP